ncbi:hypothetical protein BOTCAL_0009g00270 [Botryotinia calthae]|uniref:Zinc finger PHD-type domain-containing protein n=1 Tax=Botryotinia calthae TaxID=38488 RepID=A0A4Y8DGR2_9HELO|nr:hypothetical protein BOTCAL_0009g00270 [Botryotinia calthae]
MVDMPVIKTSPSPEASSRRILHALTPPPFDYTQYMESPSDEPKPFNTQDDYSILPPLPLQGSEYDTPQHRYWFSYIEGCEKIEKDCQAGNLPANVTNRAKYLWRILSQAAADYNCLRLDETMDKLPAVLVACCIYIACQQCKISRTFIAIRVLTETSSLKFHQSVRKSFQIIQKYIDETKCSCFRAFRAPSEACCQICHRLYKEDVVSGTSESLVFCLECSGAYHTCCAKSLNATIATPDSSGLICRRCVPCIIHPDAKQSPGKTTEKPLVTARNSVSSKSNKSEKIRKTLNLSDDQNQSPGTVKEELKANSIDSGIKRNRGINEPSDQACKVFKIALVSHRSKSGTESSTDHADSSSKPEEKYFPQHSQAISTGPQRSGRYEIDSELEEGEIKDHSELKFRKYETVMRPSQQRKARRTRLAVRGKMT